MTGPADALEDPTDWRRRVERIAGPVDAAHPLSTNAWLVEAGGRRLVAKVGPGARDEADGLRRLSAVTGAPPVPAVVFDDDTVLVTVAIDQVARTPAHEEHLGHALAALHASVLPAWGGGSSWVGACAVDPSTWADGAGFYGGRWTWLAARCGLEDVVARVVTRLPEVLPPGGPALVHGDLWWGNVLFGLDGRTWLIDPSVHGGHPEEDLAMLALFGALPDHLLDAYQDVRPLHDGWPERVALFQLSPLLVHAVLFGGGYGSQARAIARRFA
ncbi:MAG TPA: fructosamine kinase family protein [Acidimicrobiales bacterium]|nr:fructosamine kinase family protein [Acidimicrobiales bacterium]